MGAHAFVIAYQAFSKNCCSHRISVHHRIGRRGPRTLVVFTPGGSGRILHDIAGAPRNTIKGLAVRYGSSLRGRRTAHDRLWLRRRPVENVPASSKWAPRKGAQWVRSANRLWCEEA
jgi:hypothetical protein